MKRYVAMMADEEIKKHIMSMIKGCVHDIKSNEKRNRIINEINNEIEKYNIVDAKEKSQKNNCIKIMRKENISDELPKIRYHRKKFDPMLATYVWIDHRTDNRPSEPRLRVIFISEFSENLENYCVYHDPSQEYIYYHLWFLAGCPINDYRPPMSHIMRDIILDICKIIPDMGDINDMADNKILDELYTHHADKTGKIPIALKTHLYKILDFVSLYLYCDDNAVGTVYGRIIDIYGIISMLEGKELPSYACWLIKNKRKEIKENTGRDPSVDEILKIDGYNKPVTYNKSDKRIYNRVNLLDFA